MKILWMYTDRGWVYFPPLQPPVDFEVDHRAKHRRVHHANARPCNHCHQVRAITDFKYKHFNVCNDCLNALELETTYTTVTR